MRVYKIYSAGEYLYINTDLDEIIFNDIFWKAYIPDFKYISEVKKLGNKFFSIIIKKGKIPFIKKIGFKKFIFNYTGSIN